MSLILAVVMGLAIAAAVFAVVSLIPLVRTAQPSRSGLAADAVVAGNLRALVQTQRNQKQAGLSVERENLAMLAALEVDLQKKRSDGLGRLTLGRKLVYARWSITPLQFRAIQAFCTIGVFLVTFATLRLPLQILAVVLTPLLVEEILWLAVHKRFLAFDRDYPVMLMQYVSLLKTGMTAVSALSSAARALDKSSLVRAEAELLVERLRLGLNEEQAISAFGEDIAHPEIELFVQSLLLHQRLGGNLSSTLERLAKQVRKRQQFREQAYAAVAMERTSIFAIAMVLTGLMVYMWFQAPELVKPAFIHDTGMGIFQSGIALIIFGFYWSTQVTKLRI